MAAPLQARQVRWPRVRRARHDVLPSPLRGGVGGGGTTSTESGAHPPPCPSPARGEGIERARCRSPSGRLRGRRRERGEGLAFGRKALEQRRRLERGIIGLL